MVLRGFLLQTFLVVVASFVLATVESQTVTVFPPNVGAQAGELNVPLGCNVTGLPANNFIEWTYYPAWKPTGFPIYSTYNSLNKDPTNFTVSHTTLPDGTQSLDLVINTAKPELATPYLCHLSPASEYQATIDVVVLDPMECPSIGSSIEYDEFNEANISCSVNYYQDSTLKYEPMVTWYRGGQEIPGVVHIKESPTRKTALLTKNVTSADDDKEFVCVVDFLMSIPDYSENCSTVFYVRHAVSEIIFYPPSSFEAPVAVPVGNTINCTANGRPLPTIEWYNSAWELLSEQSELLVTEEMRTWPQPITFYCRANNTIDYVMNSVENNYTFTVVEAIPPEVQSSGVEAWVIAVAVIVPIVIIAAIIITVVLVVRHRKKKKKMKAKTTNGSAAARPTTTTTTTAYTAVPPADVIRPPPTSAPRTTGSITSNRGPPGPDNGLNAYGENPGFGDLGVQPYGGSNQAVNAFPPARSVHGSNQALGAAGVSMNPNPGYPVRSNPALNASITQRPAYPYTGSNSALNTSLSVGGPNAVAPSGASYGRQPSIASSSGRSHASSYNAPLPAINRYGNDLSSMHGSEV